MVNGRGLCNAYAALGARGVSILCVNGMSSHVGLLNMLLIGSRAAILARAATRTARSSAPAFPPRVLSYVEVLKHERRMSDVPQVTTVGGTAGANPEVGIGYSGGGWSNVFPVPDYQKDAVQSYVNGLNGNNTQLFNAVIRLHSASSLAGADLPTERARVS
jgi:hypothetical protein